MFDDRPSPPVQDIALLLLPEFTMMPVTSVLETLRLANLLAGRTLYRWSLLSADGGPVAASNGIRMAVNGGPGSLPPGTMVMVCAGLNAEAHAGPQVLSWLKAASAQAGAMGGLCTGVNVLAAAGLLDGRRLTLHWELIPDFRAAHPESTVTGHFYEIDGNRFTCAGGTAAVDMMLAMISAAHGPVLGPMLAGQIADNIVHPPVKARDERQPRSVSAALGTRHPKVLAIIRQMEATLDAPLKPSVLARNFGLSVRQLERLFQRYLAATPKQFHQRLRLQRARLMLIQTGLSVAQISAACGFSNPSYFSRCYSSLYDRPPKEERGIPKLRAA